MLVAQVDRNERLGKFNPTQWLVETCKSPVRSTYVLNLAFKVSITSFQS